MFKRTRLVTGAVASLALLACPAEKKVEPAPVAPTPPPRTAKVTVLVTGHETGHLPLSGARLIGQWTKEEGWPDAMAFSTGDSFAGMTISSHFDGTPTAEVMKALQYKAAAFGNHDFDLGLETFEKFRTESGVQVLAANLKQKADAEHPLKLAPGAVFTREGVRVGVVGFTSSKTVTTMMSGKASDLELVPLDKAIGPALDEVKKDKPEAMVALIDDCFQVIKPVLDAHPEWKFDLVVGSRCAEGAQEDVSGATKYFSTGDDLTHYVAATFEAKGEAVTLARATRKEVKATSPEDADLVALRERWTAKLNEVMGEKLGFSKKGLPETADELRMLVAVAMRDRTKADAAIINKKGVRSALPAGPVTRATVYDLIPFENALVTVKLKGEVLQKLKSEPTSFVVAPAKVDPAKEYVVATTDYLYFGGDGLGLDVVAPNPDFTGQVWQTPVVEWLREHKSDEKKPLEGLLKSLK